MSHRLEKNLQITYLIKDLSRIYKELFKVYNERTNNAIKKWAKYLNSYFTEEDTGWHINTWKGAQCH